MDPESELIWCKIDRVNILKAAMCIKSIFEATSAYTGSQSYKLFVYIFLLFSSV